MDKIRRFCISAAATKALKSAGEDEATLGRALALLFKAQMLGEVTPLDGETPEVRTLMRVIGYSPYPSPEEKESKQESAPHTPCKEINKEKEQTPPEPYISINPPRGGISGKVVEALFTRFWAAYPRKVGKQAARRKFAAIMRKLDEADASALLSHMLKAVNAQAQSEQWSDTAFIPHPTTWLNQGRWEDEGVAPQRSQADIERELAASYF